MAGTGQAEPGALRYGAIPASLANAPPSRLSSQSSSNALYVGSRPKPSFTAAPSWRIASSAAPFPWRLQE